MKHPGLEWRILLTLRFTSVLREVAEVGKGPRLRTPGPDGSRSSSSPWAMTLLSISDSSPWQPVNNCTGSFKNYSAWTPDRLNRDFCRWGHSIRTSRKLSNRFHQTQVIKIPFFYIICKTLSMPWLVESSLYRKIKPKPRDRRQLNPGHTASGKILTWAFRLQVQYTGNGFWGMS